MTTEIKLIACDLDGTLLNNHKVISQATIEKLIEYEKQGYMIALASGRYYPEVERFAKELKLDEYHGYAICGNGYEIIDVAHQRVTHFDTISKELAHACIDLAHQCHLMQYISINNRYHLSVGSFEKIGVQVLQKALHSFIKLGNKRLSYASHLLDKSIFEKDLKPFIQDGIVKICVIGSPANQKKWIQQLEKQYPNTFAYYPVNPYSLEITHHSVSKKNAVEYVAKLNGFTLKQVLAFGDSGNDVPLLQHAGIGVTMKNATKHALKKAKHISQFTNHEDGVIKACDIYLKKTS